MTPCPATARKSSAFAPRTHTRLSRSLESRAAHGADPEPTFAYGVPKTQKRNFCGCADAGWFPHADS